MYQVGVGRLYHVRGAVQGEWLYQVKGCTRWGVAVPDGGLYQMGGCTSSMGCTR